MRPLLVVLLAACAGNPSGPVMLDPSPTPDPPASEAPARPSAHAETGRAINAFGLTLYPQLVAAEPSDNLFFSPASIEVALALAAAGAHGETLRAMTTVLHLSEQGGHERLGHVVAQWNDDGEDRPFALAVANRLWVQDGLPLGDAFSRIATDHYGAGAAPMDFRSLGDAARAPINAWVGEQTQDRIRDLLPLGSVTIDTRLVLTNAVYFKGSWQTPFDAERTTEQPFASPGGPVTSPLMHAPRARARLLVADGFAVALLPYAGDSLDMMVVLPDDPSGLAAIESRFDAATITDWATRAEPAEIDLWLPRFELTWQAELSSALTALGMGVALSEGADFSVMSPSSDLRITGVFHKAFARVDEQGTEAAGATGVVVGITSVPAPAPIFRADHPFFFAIRDRASGALLFAGRVMEPT